MWTWRRCWDHGPFSLPSCHLSYLVPRQEEVKGFVPSHAFPSWYFSWPHTQIQLNQPVMKQNPWNYNIKQSYSVLLVSLLFYTLEESCLTYCLFNVICFILMSYSPIWCIHMKSLWNLFNYPVFLEYIFVRKYSNK